MKKLISAMKHTKDLMDAPLDQAAVDALVRVYKELGASHVDVSTVIGHPNFASYSKLWADRIHAAALNVTWRCAHQEIEGLYGKQKAVGVNRHIPSYWVDEAVKAIQSLGASIKSGDEWAIYPERTEGIFSDATSFLPQAGLPDSYADFFIFLHTECVKSLPSGVTAFLSSNNSSELLSGWMPAKIMNGVACVDHYNDGNPMQYEADIRAINTRYGCPVYVEEGAVNRFSVPTRAECDAYYAVNKKLADEGILYGYGAWGGWANAPESLINADLSLSDAGAALKSWWFVAPSPILVPPVLSEPQNSTFDVSIKSTKAMKRVSVTVELD